MKLRVYGNHLRLRLSRDEVSRVARGEALEGHVELSPMRFVYRLVPDESVATQFADGILSIHVLRIEVRRWAIGDEVSFSRIDNGGVEVLIEKDFQCLHGAGDDQADCFPNPLADVSV